MNYFELFGIPIQFGIDYELLTKKYYSLSKQYHPDKFTLKSEDEQLLSLQKSTEINSAYRILKDDQKRLKYILEFLGVEFKEGQEKMSQDFLLEIMDINEAIMELQFDPDPSKKKELVIKISDFETSLSDEIISLMKKLDFNNPDLDTLNNVKSNYLKSKYLIRMKENLDH